MVKRQDRLPSKDPVSKSCDVLASQNQRFERDNCQASTEGSPREMHQEGTNTTCAQQQGTG